MELTGPDILLLKYLARYAVADPDCIKTIYKPYGSKRYYTERLAKLKEKGNKYIALRNKQSVYALLKNGKELLKEMGIPKPAWYSAPGVFPMERQLRGNSERAGASPGRSHPTPVQP